MPPRGCRLATVQFRFAIAMQQFRQPWLHYIMPVATELGGPSPSSSSSSSSLLLPRTGESYSSLAPVGDLRPELEGGMLRGFLSLVAPLLVWPPLELSGMARTVLCRPPAEMAMTRHRPEPPAGPTSMSAARSPSMQVDCLLRVKGI